MYTVDLIGAAGLLLDKAKWPCSHWYSSRRLQATVGFTRGWAVDSRDANRYYLTLALN